LELSGGRFRGDGRSRMRVHGEPIAPFPILVRHSNNQRFDSRRHGRPSWAALARSVILLRNEFPMPGQERVLCHNRCDLGQHLPSYSFGLRCQSSSLVIVEAKPTASDDDLKVPLVHPTGQRHENEPEWIEDSDHFGNAFIPTTDRITEAKRSQAIRARPAP